LGFVWLAIKSYDLIHSEVAPLNGTNLRIPVEFSK
jgi:hypothetical protein